MTVTGVKGDGHWSEARPPGPPYIHIHKLYTQYNYLCTIHQDVKSVSEKALLCFTGMLKYLSDRARGKSIEILGEGKMFKLIQYFFALVCT